jgi:aspartate/methionine/tyrosine aminotransferase
MDVSSKEFKNIVDAKTAELCPADLTVASIREIVHLVMAIEKETGVEFIRMEMGIPGLPPSPLGVEAEIKALREGVASKYPPIDGIPSLKSAAARFVKSFLDIDVSPADIAPTVGAMQAAFAVFLTARRADPAKNRVLFLDPGFPVQKRQAAVLGAESVSLDVHDHRGKKLRPALERIFAEGGISVLVYSTPNNPSWICYSEEELKTIGTLASEHGAVVVEDLAYFCMDFRHDYSKPGEPPYPPTVAKWTDDYVLLFSASKIFSYAGQRIGFMALSDSLYKRTGPGLREWFMSETFGHALVFGALYGLTAGTSHSAQAALAAMLDAASDGEFDFLKPLREYAERAKAMKKIFLDKGFELVYAYDADEPVGDGFYFTFSYPGMSGDELMRGLLRHGVSAISLAITGSARSDGMRACVSLVHPDRFDELERRLESFEKDVGRTRNA